MKKKKIKIWDCVFPKNPLKKKKSSFSYLHQFSYFQNHSKHSSITSFEEINQNFLLKKAKKSIIYKKVKWQPTQTYPRQQLSNDAGKDVLDDYQCK
jgi:hypothetical protein